MKALRILAAAAGVLCAVTLFAQEGRPERGGRGGRGGRGDFPEPVTDSVWVIQRTQEMVEKYTLTPEQEAQVRDLNVKYAPQMNFTPQRMGFGGENGERPDFRSMTDEQRQEFMQKMQAQMQKAQEELQARTFETTAGGGAVKVVVTGKKEMQSITIDPQVVDPDDVEMLQDLIVAAVNEAMKEVDRVSEEEMGKITGGVKLPGM